MSKYHPDTESRDAYDEQPPKVCGVECFPYNLYSGSLGGSKFGYNLSCAARAGGRQRVFAGVVSGTCRKGLGFRGAHFVVFVVVAVVVVVIVNLDFSDLHCDDASHNIGDDPSQQYQSKS